MFLPPSQKSLSRLFLVSFLTSACLSKAKLPGYPRAQEADILPHKYTYQPSYFPHSVSHNRKLQLFVHFCLVNILWFEVLQKSPVDTAF